MNTASEILVIIVSAVLSLFLVVAVVLLVQVLRLIKEIRKVVAHAENVLDSAQSIGETLRRSAGPISVLNFARTMVETIAEHKHHKGEK